MNHKKILKRIILIVIILILIIIGILAYLYFATDALKSNEQLFFKYLTQMSSSENGFMENSLSSYFDKKETGMYSNKGTLSAELESANIEADIKNKVEDFNISFSGNVDNQNMKNEQDISINYSDDVNWPIKYKYVDNTFGIQTDHVSKKYLGIENNNLDEFVQKLGMDNSSIPEKIEFGESSGIEFSEQEKAQIENTYYPIIQEKFKGKQFTKSQEQDGSIKYGVQITNTEIKDLLVQILEKLKTDNLIIDKLNSLEENSNKITEQSIQNTIDSLNETEIQQNSATINVYQKDREPIGLEITTISNGNNIQIFLKKENTFNGSSTTNNNETTIQDTNTAGLTYSLELNSSNVDKPEENAKLYIQASYQGLAEQPSKVNENYEVGFSAVSNGETEETIYNFANEIEFKDNINISSFDEDEIEMLSDYDEEKLQNFMGALGQRISDVNQSQMEEIGFSEYGNPMVYLIPGYSLFLAGQNGILVSAQQNQEEIERQQEEERQKLEENQRLAEEYAEQYGIGDTSGSNSNNEDTIAEIEREQFNVVIEEYEGEQNAIAINGLLEWIASRNESGERKVEVELNGNTILESGSTQYDDSNIERNKNYNVTTEKDDDGYINKVIISEQ